MEWAEGIIGLGWVEGDPEKAINQQENPLILLKCQYVMTKSIGHVKDTLDETK